MPEKHLSNSPPQIYCDLDDVLTNFEESASQAIGVSVSKVSSTTLWDCLRKKFSFFETLPWKKGTSLNQTQTLLNISTSSLFILVDGRKLWTRIKEHNPIILSGIPRGGWAEVQKRRWCRRELGESVVVILCESRNKNRHCTSGDILIDDRRAARIPWEHSGGTFIHHKSANRTILILFSFKKTY